MAKPAGQGAPSIPTSDKAAALALTPVSRETEARLDRYVDLLREWQVKTNLISPSTLPQLWTRHVANSLQLLALAPSAKVWVDLGSGGGFPASCWPARSPRRRARRSIWSSATPRRQPSSVRRFKSPRRRGSCISPRSGILWINLWAHRLRHRAGAGSATSTHRLCGTGDEKRRKSAVSQGSRC